LKERNINTAFLAHQEGHSRVCHAPWVIAFKDREEHIVFILLDLVPFPYFILWDDVPKGI